jgi:hypothetical protein
MDSPVLLKNWCRTELGPFSLSPRHFGTPEVIENVDTKLQVKRHVAKRHYDHTTSTLTPKKSQIVYIKM